MDLYFNIQTTVFNNICTTGISILTSEIFIYLVSKLAKFQVTTITLQYNYD